MKKATDTTQATAVNAPVKADYNTTLAMLSKVCTSYAQKTTLAEIDGKRAIDCLNSLDNLADKAALVAQVVTGWKAGHFSADPKTNRTRKQTACRLLARSIKKSEPLAFAGMSVSVSQETGEVAAKESKVRNEVDKLETALESCGFTAERIRGLVVEAGQALAEKSKAEDKALKVAAKVAEQFEETLSATCKMLNIADDNTEKRESIREALQATM